MRIFRSMNISASGLTAERVRLDSIASNIANIHTTRTPDGGHYRRQSVIFNERLQRTLDGRVASNGVEVTAILRDNGEPRMEFDPDHPDARPDGYVAYPNIDLAKEMVDMTAASRAYEANVTVFNNGKTMAQKALEIGRG